MSEDQNVLEQLKNRKRTSVPSRTDSLNPDADFQSENQHLELNQGDKTISPDRNFESLDQGKSGSPSTIEELQQKLSQFPKTKRRSAIVIEEDIDLSLSEHCRSNQITVETFLEAAWVIAQSNKTTLNKITKEAQSRYKRRKEAGKVRRLITMLSKE